MLLQMKCCEVKNVRKCCDHSKGYVSASGGLLAFAASSRLGTYNGFNRSKDQDEWKKPCLITVVQSGPLYSITYKPILLAVDLPAFAIVSQG